VVMVVGAGRGPLVQAVLNVSKILEKQVNLLKFNQTLINCIKNRSKCML